MSNCTHHVYDGGKDLDWQEDTFECLRCHQRQTALSRRRLRIIRRLLALALVTVTFFVGAGVAGYTLMGLARRFESGLTLLGGSIVVGLVGVGLYHGLLWSVRELNNGGVQELWVDLRYRTKAERELRQKYYRIM